MQVTKQLWKNDCTIQSCDHLIQDAYRVIVDQNFKDFY